LPSSASISTEGAVASTLLSEAASNTVALLTVAAPAS
jgi:hypothetical protein